MSGRGERAAGRTPKGGVYRPRNARASPLYQCADRHLAELRSAGCLQRLLEERVIERLRRAELITQQFTTRLAPIAPAGGCAEGAELNIRPMCVVPDRFKHRIAASRQALQSSRPN